MTHEENVRRFWAQVAICQHGLLMPAVLLGLAWGPKRRLCDVVHRPGDVYWCP